MMKINPYHVLNLQPKAGAPCLSIYANSEQELAEQTDKAESLCFRAYGAALSDRLMKPIHAFCRAGGTEEASYPVALFSTVGFSGHARLPFSTRPLAVVARSFHVKPLLKWMQREHPFSLLALLDQEAVLYQGSLSFIEETERLPYRELRTMDGALHALDRAVYRSVQGSRTPLILAGDHELIEVYRNVSGYRAIVDEAILDEAALSSNETLLAAGVRILEPFLEQKESSLLSAYWSAERRGRTCSVLQELVQLALSRKVKHLFVNEKMNVWGKIDPDSGNFTYSSRQTEAEDDVLDDLAEIVIRNHGLVTVLPPEKMPNGLAACAILNTESIPARLWLRKGYEEPLDSADSAVS